MAKRTKAQKKRLIAAVSLKSAELYLEGLLSVKDVEAIERITNRAFNKIK
tara:strand:- start:841 stop:990 length:150 start_codon:yes stop_codon:yes gene_type:complete